MKKILFFSIATAIVCGIMLWHNSVKNLSEQFRYDGKFIWEHQLDYVKGHNSVTDNPLKLIEYEYVKPLNGIVDAFFYIKNTQEVRFFLTLTKVFTIMLTIFLCISVYFSFFS